MPNLQYTSKPTMGDSHSADKMLTKALLPSALGIVICIILLCGTTFAWLNDSVQTGSSTLTAGNFAVSVSAATNAKGTGMQCKLENGENSVTVTNTGSSKTGYAILTIHKEMSLIKSYLIKFDDSNPGPVTVTIITPSTGAFSVGVTSYWGTNSPTCDELPESKSINLTDTGMTTDKTSAAEKTTSVEETTTPETTPDNLSETTPETTADNNENENGGK